MKKIPFHTQILLGMAAGIAVGFLVPQSISFIKPLGHWFIKLLKMAVLPLIFISIMDGIARVGSAQKLSQIGLKIGSFYTATNLLAVITGLILVNWIQPGRGVKIFGDTPVPTPTAPSAASLFDFIPSNIFQAFVEGNSMQIIFVAIVFGILLVKVRDSIPSLIQLLGEANIFVTRLTEGIIKLAPLGVFSLMAVMVQSLDWSTLWGIGKFAFTIILGLIIHGAITLPIFLRIFSNRPVLEFATQMQPALLAAFSTSSSSACLPMTLHCIEKEAKISPEIAGFVLPVGATVNMDGTAIYEAVACLFVAQAIGIDLSLGQQLIVFFTAALAAVGAAAIPSAGLVTLALVLTSVGLPLEGIGFLLAIDRPLDMSRTIVNVWGDMVGCAVVEGKIK